MSDGSLLHELIPGETYQIDSDEYDSGDEGENIAEAEYDQLVSEAENGFSDDEMALLTAELKEKGLVNFLRDYLVPVHGAGSTLRKLLLGLGIIPPPHLRSSTTPDIQLLPYTKIVLSRLLRRRAKLPAYNSVDDAVALLAGARNIIVLSGAGISTSCGIPDFRSANGLYAQIQEEGEYDLTDPQEMFDIRYFREQPEVFYSFAKQIYPSNFVPSPCHRWIKLLEDKGKVSTLQAVADEQLLRNYTQNIDTLETLAGVQNVLQCHGSFATASCLRCKRQVPGTDIKPSIMRQEVPKCDKCVAERDAAKAYTQSLKGKGKSQSRTEWSEGADEEDDSEWQGGEPGIMKPDITFFGQALDSKFDESLFRDREKVDLLVIIGTSLKVAPVSEVCTHIPHSVPQIFINLTPVAHVQPDICLLGDADTIVTYLSHRLGWDIPPPPPTAEDQASRIAPVVANPADVEFVSGVGPLSHMHMLRASMTEETSARSEATLVDRVLGDGTNTTKPDSVSGTATAAASQSRPANQTSPSASGRPAKRHRMEFN